MSRQSVVSLLSVCRLSVMTLLRPTHRIEIFGNIFAAANSLGTWAGFIILKFWKIQGVAT